MKKFTLLSCLAFVMVLQSCRKNNDVQYQQPDAGSVSSKVATEWMEQTRQIVKSEGKNPPQASRIYAYTAIALYESVLPGLTGYQSLANQVPGLTALPDAGSYGALDYTTVVNEAMYYINLGLVPAMKVENASAVEALRNRYYILLNSVPATVSQNSRQYGKAVALAVLNRAKSDNFSVTRSMSYTVPDWNSNASYWAPTDHTNLTPVEPYWGKVKCFAMTASTECEVAQAVPFSATTQSAFYKQAIEVYNTAQNLTAKEKAIANWWADGGGTPTPPGHWLAIENQLAKDLNLSLGKAAEMYALVNIGMADAFISCWDAKYKFNLLRPETYIHNYLPNGASWKPFIPTPPFPEYPSGHSVSSGAAAGILTAMFGNVAFTDNTNVNLGLAPRSYKNFDDAANEAAISRLYGGIHYRDACENGVVQGKLVAKSIFTHLKLKK